MPSKERILQQKAVARHERKKTDNPREGWEDGTPPPHRDFKDGQVKRKETENPKEG